MAKTEKNEAAALDAIQAGRGTIISPDNPTDPPGCQDEAGKPDSETAPDSRRNPQTSADLRPQYAVTAEGGLYIREAPSLDSPALAALPCGAGVYVTGEAEDGFLPVRTGRLAGYMMARHLEPLPPEPAYGAE